MVIVRTEVSLYAGKTCFWACVQKVALHMLKIASYGDHEDRGYAISQKMGLFLDACRQRGLCTS